MKKRIFLGSLMLMVVIGAFCVNKFVFSDAKANKIAQETKTHYKTEEEGVCYEYYQNEDGKWCVNGYEYAERKVLRGVMPMASSEGTYVVLTNDPEITFQEVSNSIVSNSSNDQLDVDRAYIVRVS